MLTFIIIQSLENRQYFVPHKKSYNAFTAVTNNTRPIVFKRVEQSCVLVGVNQRKAVGINFNSDTISKQQNQVIESFIR